MSLKPLTLNSNVMAVNLVRGHLFISQQNAISERQTFKSKPLKSAPKRRGLQSKRVTKKSRFTSGSYQRQLLTGKQCCVKNCLTTVLTPEEIEACLNLFWEKTEEEQRAFIFNYFFITKVPADNGRSSYEYKINGKRVCQEAWKRCYGISNGR